MLNVRPKEILNYFNLPTVQNSTGAIISLEDKSGVCFVFVLAGSESTSAGTIELEYGVGPIDAPIFNTVRKITFEVGAFDAGATEGFDVWSTCAKYVRISITGVSGSGSSLLSHAYIKPL